MDQSPSATERLVMAVHRRMVVVRALEKLGMGMLAGAIVVLLLIPIAWWRDLPVWPITVLGGTVGLIVGGALAMYLKPSRQATIWELDRQLHLDQLLITAMSPGAFADAAFVAIVRQVADARCATAVPDALLLRRLGLRSWSAIGSAMALVVLLAVIPFGSTRSSAVDANASVLSGNSMDRAESTRISSGAAARANDPMSENSTNSQITTEQAAAARGDAASNRQSSTSNTGAGGGAAGTESRSHTDQRHQDAIGRNSAGTGTTGSGAAAGAQTDHPGNGSTVDGGTSHRPRDVSAWTGSAGFTKGGSETLDRAPAEDRELIRDYFRP